ncbi:MAG: hypothetical protein ABL999_14815 [Pyrinomonadaceae bacterium]
MLMYFLIGLSLVLVGIVGLQFSYMFWVERLYKERRTYLRQLEAKYARQSQRLAEAERRLAEQKELLETAYPAFGKEDEVWADVIEEL